MYDPEDVKPPLPATGRGRVFHDGAVHDATWGVVAWLMRYEQLVTLADGRELIVSDAYPDLGFVYRAPDSGSEMTNLLVLLADGEADPVDVPDQATVTAAAFPALGPMHASVAAGVTDPDDLDFCRQLFGSRTAMLRTIQRTGSLEAAHAAILKDVFRL